MRAESADAFMPADPRLGRGEDSGTTDRREAGRAEPKERRDVMADELPDDIRESLHAVLFHVVEREGECHYRLMDKDGEGYSTYEHARSLIKHFGFDDLAATDLAIHDWVFNIDDDGVD
jgi:hypothetical protein